MHLFLRRQTASICSSLTQALLLKTVAKGKKALRRTRTRCTNNLQPRIAPHPQALSSPQISQSNWLKRLILDPAHLSRMFKHFQKESPYAFLVRLKMGHAASLLIKPDTLVKDVAYELGFDNPSHFSRSFKRFHGVSPEGFIGKSKR